MFEVICYARIYFGSSDRGGAKGAMGEKCSKLFAILVFISVNTAPPPRLADFAQLNNFSAFH